jgi:hypothetical protein
MSLSDPFVVMWQVVLFDEFEKAHREVANLLLQVTTPHCQRLSSGAVSCDRRIRAEAPDSCSLDGASYDDDAFCARCLMRGA